MVSQPSVIITHLQNWVLVGFPVFIWTNLVILEFLMLYTKFQGHRLFGYEGDFWKFLPYMVLETILVMWPRSFEHIFIPTSLGGVVDANIQLKTLTSGGKYSVSISEASTVQIYKMVSCWLGWLTIGPALWVYYACIVLKIAYTVDNQNF